MVLRSIPVSLRGAEGTPSLTAYPHCTQTPKESKQERSYVVASAESFENDSSPYRIKGTEEEGFRGSASLNSDLSGPLLLDGGHSREQKLLLRSG